MIDKIILFFIFQIDEWLKYDPIFSSGSEFENACSCVDGLSLRQTYLVGYRLSVADIAITSGLAGEGFQTVLN